MSRISKSFSFLFIVLIAASSLIMVKPAFAQTPSPIPTSIPETQNFTYALPNYTVNYTIVTEPLPDANSINPAAYNILVYGPPPFPIQISFNETTYYGAPQNMTMIMSVIMTTDALSTSIACFSYPTKITMTQVNNESVSPSPSSSSTSPAPASSTIPTPTSTPTVPELSWLAILPSLMSAFAVVVIIKHQKTSKA